MVNSTLIYILIGLIFCELYYSKATYKFFIPFLILVISFHWVSTNHIKEQIIVTEIERKNIENINKGGIAEYNFFYAPGSDGSAVNILHQANSKNLFASKPIGYVSHILQIKNNFITDTSKIKYEVEEMKRVNDSIYYVAGWIFISNVPSYKSTIMVGLEDTLLQMFVEKPLLKFRSGVTNNYKKDNCDYDRSGFSRLINLNKYPKGDYNLNILISVDSLFLKVPLQTTIKR